MRDNSVSVKCLNLTRLRILSFNEMPDRFRLHDHVLVDSKAVARRSASARTTLRGARSGSGARTAHQTHRKAARVLAYTSLKV